MKITIELERADMTPEASTALVNFLAAIPAAPEKASPKRRVPKPKAVAEVPPANEAGDDPFAPAPVAPPAAPPAPVAPPAAPAVVPAATAAPNLDDLRTALREHAAAHSREAAIEVLKTVGGAISVSAIDPANIAATITALRAAPTDPLA